MQSICARDADSKPQAPVFSTQNISKRPLHPLFGRQTESYLAFAGDNLHTRFVLFFIWHEMIYGGRYEFDRWSHILVVAGVADIHDAERLLRAMCVDFGLTSI